jgi:outer membrane protein
MRVGSNFNQRKHFMPPERPLRLHCKWVTRSTLTAYLLIVAGPAGAETLKEALTAAYLYNPTLKAARAQLRSADSGVTLAKSGYRPTIAAGFQGGYENTRFRFPTAAENQSEAPLSGAYNPWTAEITLQQNVFDGFRTYNNIKGAEAIVEAGREDLRASEENVLLNAATAYMNVVRDQAIVRLRQNHIRVLAERLRATEVRFKAGEVTPTDVAQSELGLAQAQADLSIAQGTLFGDQALFAEYIGHPPGTLRDPGPPINLLPKTLQDSIDIAQAENPAILAAIFRERAQQHELKQFKGQLLPNISLNARYARAVDPFGFPIGTQVDDTRVFGKLSIPLYEAGSVSAQVQRAIEVLSQRRQEIDAQREHARQIVSSQWGLVVAARGNVAAGKSAIKAARLALRGVEVEEKVGQRNVLDVLNSEQQSLNAHVNLVSFQRDLVVATYGVLAAMGRLTAYDIALEAELYDPARNYAEVKDAWYGWGASVESSEDPRVAPVDNPGRSLGQRSTDAPAYTQRLPEVP